MATKMNRRNGIVSVGEASWRTGFSRASVVANDPVNPVVALASFVGGGVAAEAPVIRTIGTITL